MVEVGQAAVEALEDLGVVVPAAAVDGDEPDARLDQPAGQQAPLAERSSGRSGRGGGGLRGAGRTRGGPRARRPGRAPCAGIRRACGAGRPTRPDGPGRRAPRGSVWRRSSEAVERRPRLTSWTRKFGSFGSPDLERLVTAAQERALAQLPGERRVLRDREIGGHRPPIAQLVRHDGADGRVVAEGRAEPAREHPVGRRLVVVVAVRPGADQREPVAPRGQSRHQIAEPDARRSSWRSCRTCPAPRRGRRAWGRSCRGARARRRGRRGSPTWAVASAGDVAAPLVAPGLRPQQGGKSQGPEAADPQKVAPGLAVAATSVGSDRDLEHRSVNLIESRTEDCRPLVKQ